MSEYEDLQSDEVSVLSPEQEPPIELIKGKNLRDKLKKYKKRKKNKAITEEAKALLAKNKVVKKIKRNSIRRQLNQTYQKPYLVKEASSKEVEFVKKPMRRNLSNVSDEEKMEVITLLQTNDYNTKRVSDMTGISQTEITKWYENYKVLMQKEILTPREISVMEMAAKIHDDYDSRQKRFIDALSIVKETALDRINKIIPTETNLRYLSETLEVLTRIESSSSGGGISVGRKNGGTILQLIQNQIMQVSKNEK